jgi:membrane-bound serine protease (ClpP class)
LTLIDAPIPEMAIQPPIAISLCIAFGIITFLLLRLAMRARRNKALTGLAALVGSTGTAMEPICLRNTLPIGRILVQGEIWPATANSPIPEKETVRVTGFHEDVLEVQPATETPLAPVS